MRFLFKTLLVSCGLCAAVLFWFRPAHEFISDPSRYPDRHVAVILFGATAVLIFISHFHPTKKDLLSQSSSAAGARIFMGILTSGVALMILPFLYGWDKNIPPFIFIGGFTIMVGAGSLAQADPGGHQKLMGRK